MANEVAEKKQFTTSLSEWTNTLTGLVTRDFETNAVEFDEYSRKCAMAGMTSIYQLVTGSKEVTMQNLDMSNLREVVSQVASLQLNANAYPSECFFSMRKKQINGDWKHVIEMGVQGAGNERILSTFGENVEKVYPCWLVKDGDEFVYPKHKGIRVTDPEWNEKGLSDKVDKVVYPVQLNDGTVTYLIAERNSVKVNLFAHVRNNLMNETFGICASRFKATDKQKEEIDAKKQEIYNELSKCETVDEMIACEVARPYMSAAWKETPESMITRKMQNNAVKKFPKNYSTLAKRSFMQMDETFQESQEEISENENSEEFIVDSEVVG